MELNDADSAADAPEETLAHERRLAAYHEAGHLAVARSLGGDLRYGDIVRSGRYWGTSLFRLGPNGYDSSIEMIIATLAGPIALRRIDRLHHDLGERDREQVAEHLKDLCQCPRASVIVLNHCTLEASRLVELEWDAIEALAAAFLERESLHWREMDEVLADVDRVRQRRNWAATLARSAAKPIKTEVEVLWPTSA